MEFRKDFIIFQTNIGKIQIENIFNYLVGENLTFFELINTLDCIFHFSNAKVKIFFEKFEINNKVIIYGEIKKKRYNNLSHIEIYDNKINFLFRKTPLHENLITHLEICKNLSIEILKEILIDFGLIGSHKIPLLIQPLDITNINFQIKSTKIKIKKIKRYK